MTKKLPLLIALLLVAVVFVGCPPTSLVSIVERVQPSVVQIEVVGEYGYEWFGSGVIIEDNLVVTAAHVAKDAPSIVIVTDTSARYNTEVVHISNRYDVAILRVITSAELPFSKLGNSDDLRLGEQVFAIGSPFGFFDSVSAGVVSGFRRVVDGLGDESLIQTDTAASPGSSGGPLFNLKGKIVGIVIGGIPYGENLVFCVSSNDIQEVLTEALAEKSLLEILAEAFAEVME